VNAAVGVLIGLVASGISGVTAFWWKSRHDLKTAAAQCFDRLLKLREAKALPDDRRKKTIDDETSLLGTHMDLYLASVGAILTPRWRRRYWKAYRGMVPVLIRNDFAQLDATIELLAPLVKSSANERSTLLSAEESATAPDS
jgi:hypothetical protein